MWEPCSQTELYDLIAMAEAKMRPRDFAFWKMIRIRPIKWALPPMGDPGGGFWVVAIWGQRCIWFNDIEWGFNFDEFDQFGRINEYSGNQNELDDCIAGMGDQVTDAIRNCDA